MVIHTRHRWHLGCILLKMPAISLLTGRNKEPDTGKPVHLPVYLTAVQRKAALLAMVNVDGQLLELDFWRCCSNCTCIPRRLATHVILPTPTGWAAGRPDRVLIDGKAVPPQSKQANWSVTAPAGATVAVAEGSAAAVVRVFVADGCSAGSNASISLRGDVGPWGGLR